MFFIYSVTAAIASWALAAGYQQQSSLQVLGAYVALIVALILLVGEFEKD